MIVHARNAVAEDIGTRFNVRAYPADAAVRVVVMSGSVAFGASNDAANRRQVLGAGAGAVLDSSGRVAVIARADTNSAAGWTRDRFIVIDEPLANVAAQIERWFDIALSRSAIPLPQRAA